MSQQLSQQLYQLFCEGLDRSDVLSSTFVVTSTPLDPPGGDAAGPASIPGSPAQPSPQPQPVLEEIEPEKGKKESPDYSVQGQVGSATESPPVEEVQEDGIASPLLPVVPQEMLTKEGKTKRSFEASNSSSQQSRHLKERNANVSSVDFVDRIIAAKTRDDMFAKKPRMTERALSTDESHHDGSEAKSRACNEASDSSETDFEGASDYFKSRQKSQISSTHKNETLPKKLSLSSAKSNEESNLHLVMDCISSDNSVQSRLLHQSSSSEEQRVLSPSAARCRVYLKKKCESNSAPNKRNSSQEKICRGTNLTTTQVVQPCTQNSTSQKVSDTTQDTNSFTSLLNGVTAFVEVRSGHDNRSMGVRTQLRNLGARVLEKLNSEVTHVVFNEGASSTLRQARKLGCHLVSVLWIDQCKKLRSIASEADHPPLNLHLYDKPKPFRKLKSFQPDFEEGKAEERQRKQLKRLQARSQKAISSQPTRQRIQSESSNENESSDDTYEGTHQKQLIPDGVTLKAFSIVLRKIDAIDSSEISTSKARKNKRRLLPLRQQPPNSLSFEDIDLAERVRPHFPYSQSSASQKKKNAPPRRIVKSQCSSSQNLRRKSSCFVTGTQSSTFSKPKKLKPQMPTMVCTFMHRREIDVVAAVLKQLGGWILEPTVTSRTTHVVCGESKRTINLLRGIAHGCWILRQEWVLRSLEAGHWLDEEAFELTEFPAIQRSRVARETLGSSPNIFSTAGLIFVSKDSTPPRAEIVDLLHLCGGNLAKSARQAKVIIGPYQRRSSHSEVVHVNEQWVLDSIQENMLQPMRNYRL